MTNVRLTLDSEGEELLSIQKQIPLAFQNTTLLTIEVGDTLVRGAVTVPLFVLEDMIRKLKDK